MNSAEKIRFFSKIILVVCLISVLIMGLEAISGSSSDMFFENRSAVANTVDALIIWGVGITGSLLTYWVLQGFADIIDNTYITAQNSGKKKEDQSYGSAEWLIKASPEDKKTYADNLLKRGLISRNEYDDMFK